MGVLIIMVGLPEPACGARAISSVEYAMVWVATCVSNCENDLQGIIVPRDIELEIDYLCTTVS